MKQTATGPRATFRLIRRAMRCALKSGDAATYSATASALRALTGNWDLCAPASKYVDQASLVTLPPLPGERGRRVICYRWAGPYRSGRAMFRSAGRAA
jgi:hypothetical protein